MVGTAAFLSRHCGHAFLSWHPARHFTFSSTSCASFPVSSLRHWPRFVHSDIFLGVWPRRSLLCPIHSRAPWPPGTDRAYAALHHLILTPPFWHLSFFSDSPLRRTLAPCPTIDGLSPCYGRFLTYFFAPPTDSSPLALSFLGLASPRHPSLAALALSCSPAHPLPLSSIRYHFVTLTNRFFSTPRTEGTEEAADNVDRASCASLCTFGGCVLPFR